MIMTENERLFREHKGMFEALDRVYPDGAGLDAEYWQSRRLWMICDAAAILLNIDPRVFQESKIEADQKPPGAPQWAIEWVPGFHQLIEEIVVMARNGAITRYLDGVNDHVPMFWRVLPDEVRSLYSRDQGTAPSWENLSADGKRATWQAMSPEQRRAKARELVERHGGNRAAAGAEVGITGNRIGQLLKETEPEGESEAPLPINKYTAALGLSKPAPCKPSR